MFGDDRIAELVDSFYTDDAVVEGQGLPIQRGCEAIKAIFREARRGYKAIEIAMDPLEHPGSELAYGFLHQPQHPERQRG